MDESNRAENEYPTRLRQQKQRRTEVEPNPGQTNSTTPIDPNPASASASKSAFTLAFTSASASDSASISASASESGSRGTYNTRLTSRQKADKILRWMHQEYRWTIKDLIRSMVFDDPERLYDPTAHARSGKLIEAIWGETDILQKLQEHPSFQKMPEQAPPLNIYCGELTALEVTPSFGPYNQLLEFDSLNLSHIHQDIKRLAPRLLSLLQSLTAPIRQRTDQADRQSESLEGRFIILFSILCFTRRRNTCSNLPKLFGLYFQSMGVKRRVLQVLAGMGICETYHTINKLNESIAANGLNHLATAGSRPDAIIVYDNFDYQEQVRHQRVGDHGDLKSVTSGKVIYGRHLPLTGLRQDMLHEEVPLRLKDVLMAAGNSYDDIQKQISTYFIANAIRRQYSNAVNTIFAEAPQPSMPCLNVIKPSQTHHFSLGPIPYNEGTIQGTYGVLETIFMEQFKLDPMAFNERLWLVYGDQKTASNIRSVINERREASTAFDRHRWVLPLSSFFHLRQTFLWMLQALHFGSENQNSPSTLYHNVNFWERKQIPAIKGPFHHVEELILHSFEARIIALLHVQLREVNINIEDSKAVEEYLTRMTVEEYLLLVDNIYQQAFSKDIQQPSTDSNHQDEEFRNHVRYLQQVETYATLKYAIKHADIGLIERVIDRCCIYFHGSKQTNYAFEMLLFKRLLATGAASVELKKAILVNGLVNLQGKEDTSYEIDRLNEQLNLQLKEILWARRTSTFGMDKLFHHCALTASYCGTLKEFLESEFGEKTWAGHTEKAATTDIRDLAYEISKRSIVKQPQGRKAVFKSPDIIALRV